MKTRLALVALFPLFVFAAVVAFIRVAYATITNPKKAFKIAVGFDQLGNVATNGSEDETISSRANRARSEGRRWGCVLCKILDAIDENHCAKSAGH